MTELIDLSKWKKQKEIIEELHRENGINITPREWRTQVEKHNKMFLEGKVDTYITHSNSLGYKATKDYQEAKIARNDYFKRAINMIKKARECDRAFLERNNCKLDFDEGEIK